MGNYSSNKEIIQDMEDNIIHENNMQHNNSQHINSKIIEEDYDEDDEQDTGHAKKISLKKLNKATKSISKLKFGKSQGTGFFMMISNKNNLKINCLITNCHNISQNDVEVQKTIIITIYNEKQTTIKLNNYERFIQCFLKPIDITIIEILDSDNISKDIIFLNYD